MIEIFNGSVYNFGESSSLWVITKYEKKRSGASMLYRFNYKISITNRSGVDYGYGSYANNLRCTFILNNKTVWSKDTKSSATSWSFEYTTEWFNVEDKTNGTVPFKFTIKDTQNSSWCNYSSSTYQLQIDPAGSTIKSLSNFNIGQPFSLTTNKYNVDFYDKLVIKLGSTTVKTMNGVGSTIQVDFTSSELNTIYGLTTNVQNADFTFELSSYDDSSMATQIGESSTKVVKGYIIASNPIISSKSAVDTNNTTIALTGNNTTLIKYNSNVKVSVVATGQNQATIKSVTINGITATLTNGAYVVSFNKTTINTFNIVVTDSRDFPTTASITLDMINYIELTLSPTVVRNQPTDGKAKISYSGNYFNGSFGSVSNTLKVQYRFKEKGQEFTVDDEWIDMAPTITNNTYKESSFIADGVDYQKIYVFQVQAIDELDVEQATEIILPKGLPVYNWDEDNFNVNVNATMQKDLKVAGNLKVGKSFATDPTNSFQTGLFGSTRNGFRLQTIRSEMDGVNYFPNDCTGIAFTGDDTHGFILPHYSNGKAWIGAGGGDKLNWVKEIQFKEDIESEFYYKKGETVELILNDGVMLGGGLTTSKTEIFLTMFTPKSLKNISSITVNTLKANIRGTAGYTTESYVSGGFDFASDSDYTITATKSNENSIYIIILKSSAMNGTNNTVVNAMIFSLNVTFS